MAEKGKFIIRPNGPNDFESSFSFYRRSRFELVDRFGDSHFIRPFEFENVPVLIKIACRQAGLDKTLSIEWSSPNEIKNKSGLRHFLTHMFYLDFDLERFYHQRLDRVMKMLTRRFIGFRPILTPTVFEAAAWAIIGQQINLQFAYKIKSRLVKQVNRHFELDGEKYYLFPRAEDCARLNTATLVELKFSRQKIEYILGLSRMICDGELDLNELSSMEFAEAEARLLSIRGIGPWTANYILLRGIGHPDAWPVGDSGINQAVRNLYNLNGRPNAEYILELGERWRPYRSLAGYYLWKSL